MSIEIRYVSASDIDSIVEFAVAHAPEIPSWGEVDPDILSVSLYSMTLQSNYFLRGVFVDGKFKGGMVGEINPTWFNSRFESNGRTIYLHKDLRGKGIAKQLYKDFDNWVKLYPYVTHGGLQTTSGVDISPLVKSLGYVKTGTTFRKRY